MKRLVVITGLSGSGKSTLLRRVCERTSRIPYFTQDRISMQAMDILRIRPLFDISSEPCWRRADRLADTAALRYWLYCIALLSVEGDLAMADGYRFLLAGERAILERALDAVWPEHRVEYLLLRPAP